MADTSKENGIKYEEYVNKYYKGKIYRLQPYDIITKKWLIEVKGVRMVQRNCQTKKQLKEYPNADKNTTHFGRYKIDIYNHKELKRIAQDKNKKPRYVFVLAVGHRLIHKAVSHQQVNKLLKGKLKKETANLPIKKIWVQE